MSLINISNVTFAYDTSYDNIFENISFQIDTDWKLGFIGRNGTGKTTFLNLLLKKYKFTGNISAGTNFEYFPYEVENKSVITTEIIEKVYPDYIKWELIRELSFLELSKNVLDRPFNTLSNGEQTKVLLALLFLKDNRFLLIDEPTNHLDLKGRKVVSDYLNSKTGFILVSHDRTFLDGCIDHVISINRTNIDIQRGNFSSWLLNKERQDNFEISKNEKLKKDINRLSFAAKQTSNWSGKVEKTKYGTRNSGLRPDRGYIGHKAEKMMKRSKSIEKRLSSNIEEKSMLLKNIENHETLKISQLDYKANRLITFDKVSIFYGKKTVCSNISFSIESGERIALCGKNGSGKSSIIKLIWGEHIKYTGNFQKGNNLQISYVAQDTSSLSGTLSNYAAQNNIDESLFKTILRKLNFSRVQFEKDISDFSEGQKKKVLIARSLCEKAHLHIWDEPLNFIDVISRIQIEELLLEFKPTILFVEHDNAFCDNIATKIISLTP
ncbi:ribosomal protection-like ABC-F family protein [Anaerovorax odorimutans]|uniref:ribosomal protection-like ABC-F family protein n=1 Tax=Anaerovorax odorimutans TaxID=109327 RepID=UPI00041F75FD|nr:ABC-F type ribosomal protection protein [Anaerovorax odorimutans]